MPAGSVTSVTGRAQPGGNNSHGYVTSSTVMRADPPRIGYADSASTYRLLPTSATSGELNSGLARVRALLGAQVGPVCVGLGSPNIHVITYTRRHTHVLQCVAVCCGVLRCVAVCCSVLQCVAVCCSVNCTRDQIYTSVWFDMGAIPQKAARALMIARQHTATHGNTLQHTATHCNTLSPSGRELRAGRANRGQAACSSGRLRRASGWRR